LDAYPQAGVIKDGLLLGKNLDVTANYCIGNNLDETTNYRGDDNSESLSVGHSHERIIIWHGRPYPYCSFPLTEQS
jgi:hypothetical protein